MGYSDAQKQMIANGVSNGISLERIQSHPEFIKAGREHAAMVYEAKATWPAHKFLSGGNHGPFKSVEERERAYGQKVRDPYTGIWKDLAEVNPEYEIALRHKTAQTSNQIMGVQEPPQPLTPDAMLRAAQEDAYQAKKADLFDKSNSPDKVVATSARLQILEMAQDPTFQELEKNIDPDPRPYETYLKSQPGGVRIQVGDGTDEEREAFARAENQHNSSVRPGGRGDGGVSGPADLVI